MIQKLQGGLLWILILILCVGLAFGSCFFILKTLHKIDYPWPYWEYVSEYAEEYDVDPALVLAIIRTESNFDPNATSEVGARGLMQLMNDAFLWVQTQINDDSVTYDDMYDPQQNIRYGTCLLSMLLSEFGGNENNAIMAYHAGQGAVSRWLSAEDLSKDSTLPEAQSEVTQEYLNKVQQSLTIYRQMNIGE